MVQHPALHSGERCWGWSWVLPQLYYFIAPIFLMLGRDRLPAISPLHSLMSPFETVAHELGAVHGLSQNLLV